MRPFERYVWWLRLFLPNDQRDDIVRELTEEFRSQVADREEAVGRPLTDDEQSGILAGFGHPLALAARYRPQRYLVGPVLFPLYVPVLAATLGILAALRVVSIAVIVASGASRAEVGGELAHLWTTAVATFAWITIAFACFDRMTGAGAQQHSPGARRPCAAVAGELATAAVSAALRDVRHRARTLQNVAAGTRPDRTSLSAFVVNLAISAWWLLALKMPALMFIGGASTLAWGPDMARLYPALAVSQLACLSRQALRLAARPDPRLDGVLRLVALAGGVAFMYLVATAGHQWVVWRHPGEPHVPQLLVLIDGIVGIAFSAAAAVAALSVAWRVVRGVSRRQMHAIMTSVALLLAAATSIHAR